VVNLSVIDEFQLNFIINSYHLQLSNFAINLCNNPYYFVISELCDPAIEEHFRRSLGRDYSDFVSSKSSPKTPTLPSPTAPPPQILPQAPTETKPQGQNATNVSITGKFLETFDMTG